MMEEFLHKSMAEHWTAYRAQAGLPLEFPESSVFGEPSNAQDPGVTGGKLQQRQDQSSMNNDEQPAQDQPGERADIPTTTAEHEVFACAEETQSKSVLEQQAPSGAKVFRPDRGATGSSSDEGATRDFDGIPHSQRYENHQRLSNEATTITSQVAEVVACLKEMDDAKKRGSNEEVVQCLTGNQIGTSELIQKPD
ncbi:hypothetical protein F511_36443 [Dorcoceras hygrometricum]|uniref:Uncharacterized protein n=1 Tax=Dorcoceras hygrometricum TaxID=472368 RepID=A0A2Z7AZ55_9LAMI|nr:hypothetical protein F511_36443 [Dorcoceras hygrometricum]